jgi:anti-sigma regulatory factor (Ser/Thr protein kinase)
VTASLPRTSVADRYGSLGSSHVPSALQCHHQILTADVAYVVLYRAGFGPDTITTVRRAVAACLSGTELSRDGADDAVLAVGEILANVMQHGGGVGDIQVTRVDRQLHVLISDRGPGMPQMWTGRRPDPVPVTAVDGRGLWLAFALCSAVALDSSADGTTVGLIIDLPERP